VYLFGSVSYMNVVENGIHCFKPLKHVSVDVFI